MLGIRIFIVFFLYFLCFDSHCIYLLVFFQYDEIGRSDDKGDKNRLLTKGVVDKDYDDEVFILLSFFCYLGVKDNDKDEDKT